MSCSLLKPFSYDDLPPYVTKVELDNYYRGTGLIFSTEYDGWLPYNNVYDKRFTPTKAEVRKSEKILIADYERYSKEKGFNTIENIKDYYWKFNRQYFGYINNNDEKLLVINLLNFKNKFQVYQYFKDWKKRYIDIYYYPTGYHLDSQFIINLDKEKIGGS